MFNIFCVYAKLVMSPTFYFFIFFYYLLTRKEECCYVCLVSVLLRAKSFLVEGEQQQQMASKRPIHYIKLNLFSSFLKIGWSNEVCLMPPMQHVSERINFASTVACLASPGCLFLFSVLGDVGKGK